VYQRSRTKHLVEHWFGSEGGGGVRAETASSVPLKRFAEACQREFFRARL
jgi:hypothetical protein